MKETERVIKYLANLIKARYLFFISLIILFILYFVLYKIYIPRVNAFGCFDDCNNFMRGYFVLHGKALFSEVFSGHQPFGSYISTFIQAVTNPQSIFELVLRHRQFIFIFGLFFNMALVFRFGARMLFFIIAYEFSKFYLFGDRFLGEAMLVYPALYLTGILLLKISGKKIYSIDYIISAIFSWFIIFTRAPYAPLALFLFAAILWNRQFINIKKISLALFAVLSIITVFAHNINDYFFNVAYFNLITNIPADFAMNNLPGPRIIQSFFYPLYIPFFGEMNIFRILLIALDIVFLIFFLKLIKDKKYLKALLIWIVLGLANIRIVVPGSIFYGSFHLLVWYAILIFVIFEQIFSNTKNKLLFLIPLLIISFFFIFFITSPQYFGRERIDTHEEFITNYGRYLQVGEVVKDLSDPDDELFIDGFDDLIYWQSKKFSSYKYSWYTSSMVFFSEFSEERIKMFMKNPPEFYYGSCPDEADRKRLIPSFASNDYQRLYEDGKPSCLWIRKDKISEITQSQWKKAEENLYTLNPRD